jgi:hypothetical protein
VILGISTALDFGVLYFLPSAMFSFLGLSFVAEQVAIFLLFISGMLVWARFLSGIIFAYEWIPRRTSAVHQIVRLVVFLLAAVYFVHEFGSLVFDMSLCVNSSFRLIALGYLSLSG